ncbi:hypothetical protein AVEN_184331-1, partial [Araneus ventricosus]
MFVRSIMSKALENFSHKGYILGGIWNSLTVCFFSGLPHTLISNAPELESVELQK